MYAIVQQGGHQYRLTPGDLVLVDRLPAEVGSMITLEPVLLLGDSDGSSSGLDAARGARVAAVVIGHRLGRKLRVFKYKPKKRYRRTHGHRSRYTELRVEALLTAGQPLPTPAPVVEKTPAAASEEEAPKRRRAARPAREAAAPAEPVSSAPEAAGTAGSEVDEEAGGAGFEEV